MEMLVCFPCCCMFSLWVIFMHIPDVRWFTVVFVQFRNLSLLFTNQKFQILKFHCHIFCWYPGTLWLIPRSLCQLILWFLISVISSTNFLFKVRYESFLTVHLFLYSVLFPPMELVLSTKFPWFSPSCYHLL